MWLTFLLAAAAVVSAPAAAAPAPQSHANCLTYPGEAPHGAPSFSQYPARQVARRKSAPIHLERRTDAWLYRTVLREGYGDGQPDFAGHYRIVTWGCGTGCVAHAVVDVMTGRVIFDPFMDRAGAGAQFPIYGFTDSRLGSRLFVALGAMDQGSSNDNEGIEYLLWTGKWFVPIAFFPDVWICQNLER
jgi:hypothetical protein